MKTLEHDMQAAMRACAWDMQAHPRQQALEMCICDAACMPKELGLALAIPCSRLCSAFLSPRILQQRL